MRAWRYEGLIGLANLNLVELPDPGDALVRIRACSVNFRDLTVANGGYGRTGPPHSSRFLTGLVKWLRSAAA